MEPGVANRHVRDSENRTIGGVERNHNRPALRYWNNKLIALLVDESDSYRILGTAYLTAYGVETHSVMSGRAAMEKVYSGCRFTIIFIDMHMRFMSGAQCVRNLRDMGVRCPMVGMTSFCREREEQEFLEAGGNGFIAKPLNPDNFIRLLERLDDSLN